MFVAKSRESKSMTWRALKAAIKSLVDHKEVMKGRESRMWCIMRRKVESCYQPRPQAISWRAAGVMASSSHLYYRHWPRWSMRKGAGSEVERV
jgi:hypothetical protein